MENRINFWHGNNKYEVRFPDPASEEDRRLFEKAFSDINELYGCESTAVNKIMGRVNMKSLEGSSLLFGMLLSRALPKGQRVMLLKDWEMLLETRKGREFMRGYCSKPNQILISSESDSSEENIYLTKDLASKVRLLGYNFSPENPLVITGAKIEEPDSWANPYGVTFNLNEACMKNDERFGIYRKEITFGKHTRKLTVNSCGVFGIEILGARYLSTENNLPASEEEGRIAIIKKID